MKQHIIQIVLIIVLLVFCELVTGCNNTPSEPDWNTVIMNDPQTQSIYLNSMPSDVSVLLGDKVEIQNAKTTFGFVSVIENTLNSNNDGDAKILLEVDYGTSYKRIILNINSNPNVYYLENDKRYLITLKSLEQEDNTYKLTFIFNEYGLLKTSIGIKSNLVEK